jgi:hypothetical protein
MTKEELQVITGLIAGQTAALTVLCNLLAAKGVTTKEEIAETFEASAATMDDPLRTLGIRLVADAVRNSTSPEANRQVRDLLDRLQRGSEPPPAARD